ncbi:MAG TPA: UrcA family protein [Caulobacteraceae bacterium]
MNKRFKFGRMLMIAAMAATPVLATAAGAQAEDLRIRVGDLSQTGAAKAFNERLDHAARLFCAGMSRADLARSEACKAAIREEALAQLSAAQRAQLDTPQRGMAMGYGSH